MHVQRVAYLIFDNDPYVILGIVLGDFLHGVLSALLAFFSLCFTLSLRTHAL